ncbi:MAG: Major facilitator superfamily 1, partial [Actinomycetia bacterium]|nr:Major facilitator superfamily 1 [Actinomycetes bacterium]
FRTPSASYLIGAMPAERASVPDAPAIPTHNERDIHQDTARSGLRLGLILVASFMVVLDFTIVNIALPSMERDFGVATSVVQWVVTGYAIAFSGLLILGGRAADMLGRRRIFIVGLVVFSLASLAGGLAGDPVLLVASRIVQGAGAALVAPAALSLITTSFPPGPRRTRAIGLYGSMASVGFVAGQVLGGVLVEWTSWRAVFLVNVPVGLAAAFVAPRVIPLPAGERASGRAAGPGGNQRGRRLDVRGAVLITAAIALAVFSISQGDVLGWTSPLVLGAAVIAVGAAACFVVAETRHPAPLVRPRLLLRPGLRNGAALAFLLGVWNGGELLVLSLYMQQVLRFSPLVTGMIIAPQGIAGFTMGMLAPRLAGRFGVRRVAMLAGVSATIGFAALTQLPAVGYSPLLFVVILVGFGGAGTAFGSIVLASRELSDGDQGLAGGVVNTSRQMGAAVGAALLPAVAESMSGVSGDRAAMLAATAAALAATAVAWRAARQASSMRPSSL